MHRVSVCKLLRFQGQQLLRTPGKSLLAVLLAAAFAMGLAYLNWRVAENEAGIDRLYDSVEVFGYLSPSYEYFSPGNAYFSSRTVQALEESGCLRELLVEGAASVSVQAVPMEDSTEPVGEKTPVGTAGESGGEFPVEEETAPQGPLQGNLRASADPQTLIEVENGTMEFLLAEDFTLDRLNAPGEHYVLLDTNLAAELGISLGREIRITTPNRVAETYTVVGVYYGVRGGVTGCDLLIGLDAYIAQAEQNEANYGFSRVDFTIDPAWNRELGQFRELAENAVRNGGTGYYMVPLTLEDQQLKQAIAPLEEAGKLLEVLFPVTAAVSLLAAAGLAVLLVIQSMKETAIQRVLGVPRCHTALMAAAGQLALTTLGSAAGLLAAHIGAGVGFRWEQSLLLAGLYILTAVVCAAGASAAATARNPLELLQVKE